MNLRLTELYMYFLCSELQRLGIKGAPLQEVRYTAALELAEPNAGGTRLEISGSGPRDLSFRMADIIKHHRERLWSAPAFIIPRAEEGIWVKDNIAVASGVRLGLLARETAKAIGIFLEKYLPRL